MLWVHLSRGTMEEGPQLCVQRRLQYNPSWARLVMLFLVTFYHNPTVSRFPSDQCNDYSHDSDHTTQRQYMICVGTQKLMSGTQYFMM